MSRIIKFFREVRSELSKVVWPTRRETIRYTSMVVIFSVVMSAILGAADIGLLKGLEQILNK